MALAEQRQCRWMEILYPYMTVALKEGRLLNAYGQRHYNNTTLAQVNELLARNGVAPLFAADTTSKLEDIPMYSSVPSITDKSMEVLWYVHPLRGDWKRCWGIGAVGESLLDDDSEVEAAGVNPAAVDTLFGTPGWMDEFNRDILAEAHRKHGGPAPDSGSGPNVEDLTDSQPADDEAWRESLEPGDEVGPEADELDDDDDANAPWRESLRPDDE